jgi:hypothetical protein
MARNDGAVIPWDELLPQLKELADAGNSWQAVTDAVNARFGTVLSVQAVRYRVGANPRPAGVRPSGGLVPPPYVLPPVKDAPPRFDDEAFAEALARVAESRGARRSGRPLTLAEYDDYRKDLLARKSRLLRRFPSSVAVRRRYGTWSKALDDAGLAANRARRAYDGLTADDAAVHVAHWLRWVRRHEPGAPATVSRYRLWAKERDDVPAPDTLRRFGPWGVLARAAAALEQSPDELPEAKPVGTSGPGKTQIVPITLLPPRG